MQTIDLSTELKERLQIIQELQQLILSKYGEDNYNVFLFGSFLTERYIPDKSDVDIAVYTPDFNLYLQISSDIEDFFFERNISLDLFCIDTTVVEAIYYKPLTSELRFTEYYPDQLKEFCRRCSDFKEYK